MSSEQQNTQEVLEYLTAVMSLPVPGQEVCAGATQEGGDWPGGRETFILPVTGQECTLQGQVGACNVQLCTGN